MRFDAAQLPRALELLLSATEPVRVKGGCRSCRVERDAADERVLRYTEEWHSGAAFRRHVQSEDFWRILVAMELCSEEPQINIGDLSPRGGMDILRTLREPQPPSAQDTA
jgi:quinol monooxygenase YgiN